MRKYSRHIGSFLTAAVFLCLTGVSGCAARGSVRVYDPVYSQYRYWNRSEIGYYQQWERETHRRNEDFNRRSQQEQNEYWRWRHDRHDRNGRGDRHDQGDRNHNHH